MFSFPEQHGGTNMGIKLRKDHLREVSELSRVMDGDLLDIMDSEVKSECIGLLQNPEKVESDKAIEAFRFLKRNINL